MGAGVRRIRRRLCLAAHQSPLMTGDVLREPMFMFLVGGGIVYLLLGELKEALLLTHLR